jgi:hypothetical protein
MAVAQFVLSVSARFAPAGARYLVAAVNGKPTLLIYSADGTPAIVVSLEVGEGRIQTIWAIANPDKLTAMSRSSPIHRCFHISDFVRIGCCSFRRFADRDRSSGYSASTAAMIQIQASLAHSGNQCVSHSLAVPDHLSRGCEKV